MFNLFNRGKGLIRLCLLFTVFLAAPVLAADGKSAVLDMGAIKVIALADTQNLGQLSAMLTPQDLEQTRGAAPDGKVMSYINAYLVQTKAANILIDAGLGQAQGGQLLAALQEAGIQPEDIKLILLSHLHLDHCGGLFNNGRPVFPNADIWVSKREAQYWAASADFPPSQRGSVFFARQVLASPRLRIYEPGQTLLSGLVSMPAYGHTPGHSAFLLNSESESLLIWGDIIHLPGLQFASPQLGVVYDVDSTQALETRKLLLRKVKEERLLVAGQHLPFPGWGRVEAPAGEGSEGRGEYKFILLP